MTADCRSAIQKLSTPTPSLIAMEMLSTITPALAPTIWKSYRFSSFAAPNSTSLKTNLSYLAVQT